MAEQGGSFLSECSRMIDLCEAHARANGGEHETAHDGTHDEVRAVEEVRQIFNAACERSLFPFERAYASAAGSPLHPRVDAFVVRQYPAPSALPTHKMTRTSR